MKWKKRKKKYALLCVLLLLGLVCCFGRSLCSVLSLVGELLLQLPLPFVAAAAAAASTAIYILCEAIYTEMVDAYTYDQHIYSTAEYTHYTDGDDYTRRTHEFGPHIRPLLVARCCCCLCCTDRITNTHSVDKLLGVFFFFFISVHSARATLTFASPDAP